MNLLTYPSSKCLSTLERPEVVCNSECAKLKDQRFEGRVGLVAEHGVLGAEGSGDDVGVIPGHGKVFDETC